MVAAVHTASSDLRWHPHVHGMVSRGGWDEEGQWVGVPYVDERAAGLLFRHQVLALLAREGLLGPERMALLDSWKAGHTGFSAHNRVTVTADDAPGLERMARYLLRPPLSLERLHLDGSVARYRHKRAASPRGESFDPRDLLARLLMHIPAPRLHLVRYYGRYSNVARARRKASPPATHGARVHDTEPLEPSRSRAGISWRLGSRRHLSARRGAADRGAHRAAALVAEHRVLGPQQRHGRAGGCGRQ
jgi:hypothetical protein